MPWVQHRGLWLPDDRVPVPTSARETQEPAPAEAQDASTLSAQILSALRQLSAQQNAILSQILDAALGRRPSVAISAPVDAEALYRSLMLASRYGQVIPLAIHHSQLFPAGLASEMDLLPSEGYDAVILGTFRLVLDYHDPRIRAYIFMDGQPVVYEMASMLDDWSVELMPYQYLLRLFARRVMTVGVWNQSETDTTGLLSFLLLLIERHLHMTRIVPLVQRAFDDLCGLVSRP